MSNLGRVNFAEPDDRIAVASNPVPASSLMKPGLLRAKTPMVGAGGAGASRHAILARHWDRRLRYSKRQPLRPGQCPRLTLLRRYLGPRLPLPCWPPGSLSCGIEAYARVGATTGTFWIKWREEIPRRSQVVSLWQGQNSGLRTAKLPFLECPLSAHSGHCYSAKRDGWLPFCR